MQAIFIAEPSTPRGDIWARAQSRDSAPSTYSCSTVSLQVLDSRALPARSDGSSRYSQKFPPPIASLQRKRNSVVLYYRSLCPHGDGGGPTRRRSLHARDQPPGSRLILICTGPADCKPPTMLDHTHSLCRSWSNSGHLFELHRDVLLHKATCSRSVRIVWCHKAMTVRFRTTATRTGSCMCYDGGGDGASNRSTRVSAKTCGQR